MGTLEKSVAHWEHWSAEAGNFEGSEWMSRRGAVVNLASSLQWSYGRAQIEVSWIVMNPNGIAFARRNL